MLRQNGKNAKFVSCTECRRVFDLPEMPDECPDCGEPAGGEA